MRETELGYNGGGLKTGEIFAVVAAAGFVTAAVSAVMLSCGVESWLLPGVSGVGIAVMGTGLAGMCLSGDFADKGN